MKQKRLLRTLLVALCLLTGTTSLWAATETLSGADNTGTANTGITKTSFTMLSTYDPSGTATVNSKNCLKVRWKAKDASTGDVNGFALRVNPGYKITQIDAQMSGNNTNLILKDIKVDGVSYSGSYSKTLNGSEQSTKYTNITLSNISATEYINFEYASGGDANQGFVYITVTYEERSQKVKETFDFLTMITAGYSSANTSPSQSVSYYLYGNTETTEETNCARLNYIYNSSDDRYSIGSHIYLFAHASNTDLGNTNYWWIRTSDGYHHLYNNKTNQNQRFAIVGLSKGDKFTITFGTGSLAFQTANVYLESDGTKTNVTASSTVDDCTSVQSGKTYVVSDDALGEDGSINVALVTKKAAVSISKIVIERSSVTETITAPTINVTYNGANRTVTLIDGETNSLNSGVRTYYTTDGTTPTTNSTRYTSPLDISENCTVKAISVAVNGATSTVESQEVTVGKLTVAAPTITFSSMETNGDFYSPKFVIANGDNSGIFGSPTPILSATFNGSAVDISSSYYVPSSAGTLVVTATADKYNSASTENEITFAVFTCQSTPNFNEIALTNLATTLGGTWGDSYNDRWANWTKGSGKSADLSPGISGDNNYAMSNLTSGGSVTIGSWFTFSRNRGSSALSVVAGYGLGEKNYNSTMTINSPDEGAIVEYSFGTNTPSINYVTMTSSEETAGKWEKSMSKADALRYCKYYAPATVSATITPTGYATFSSPYALDFSNAITNLEKVYYASAVAKGSVTMTELNQTVPAETGLFLKGTPDATVTIPVVASGTVIAGDNFLKANTAETSIAASTENTYHYVFAYTTSNNSNPGFYNLASALTLGAGKAYLETNTDIKPTTQAKVSFLFTDGEVTGISNVNADNGFNVNANAGKMYNAAGQLVNEDYKGIVIMNGKKVVK